MKPDKFRPPRTSHVGYPPATPPRCSDRWQAHPRYRIAREFADPFFYLADTVMSQGTAPFRARENRARAFCGPSHGAGWEFIEPKHPTDVVEVSTCGDSRSRLVRHRLTRHPVTDRLGNLARLARQVSVRLNRIVIPPADRSRKAIVQITAAPNVELVPMGSSHGKMERLVVGNHDGRPAGVDLSCL